MFCLWVLGSCFLYRLCKLRRRTASSPDCACLSFVAAFPLCCQALYNPSVIALLEQLITGVDVTADVLKHSRAEACDGSLSVEYNATNSSGDRDRDIEMGNSTGTAA